MSYVYIALVNTPGLFAGILHRVLHQKYIHVVLSFDAELEEAYSFGRRNPFVPLVAGMEKEDAYKIAQAFPTAEYQIYELKCTSEQKKMLNMKVQEDYKKRFQFHYEVLGLPLIWRQIAFVPRRHFTCSSYLAKRLDDVGIMTFSKHYSIVTPKDFYQQNLGKVIFEGKLKDFLEQTIHKNQAKEIVYEG